jgi:hypothetical protein
MPMQTERMMPAQTVHGRMGNGGHLYIQTNESHNAVIHYRRSANGAIEEVERVSTGAGSGDYNPIVNRESTPNPFEGARSVILGRDNRFLFTTKAGDNSVSSFTVDDEGRLTRWTSSGRATSCRDQAEARSPSCTTATAARSTYSTHSAPITNGRFRALNGTVSSAPSDNWLTADGAYLYQLYGNASKLVGYRTHPDGSLEEITSVAIPYNTSSGLAGF